MFIYKIEFMGHEKVYIGQTTRTLERRFREHVSPNNHSFIANKIRQFGINNARIVELHRATNQEELDALEILEIERHNSMEPNGYNLKPGGGGSSAQREVKPTLSPEEKLNLKYEKAKEEALAKYAIVLRSKRPRPSYNFISGIVDGCKNTVPTIEFSMNELDEIENKFNKKFYGFGRLNAKENFKQELDFSYALEYGNLVKHVTRYLEDKLTLGLKNIQEGFKPRPNYEGFVIPQENIEKALNDRKSYFSRCVISPIENVNSYFKRLNPEFNIFDELDIELILKLEDCKEHQAFKELYERLTDSELAL